MQVDMTVPFDTDLDLATRVVNDVGQAMANDPAWKDRLLEVPSLTRLPALGDLGVTLRVAGKVRATDRWAAPSELRKRLLVAFSEHGIEIPVRGQVLLDRPAAAGPAGASVGAGSSDAGDPGGGH
jgi:small conductance mechanosensitive channel